MQHRTAALAPRGLNVMEEKRRAKVAVVPGLATAVAEVRVADDDVEEDVLDDTSDLKDDTDAIVEIEKENGEGERQALGVLRPVDCAHVYLRPAMSQEQCHIQNYPLVRG